MKELVRSSMSSTIVQIVAGCTPFCFPLGKILNHTFESLRDYHPHIMQPGNFASEELSPSPIP
jgi:hypothetical protein